MRPLYQAPVLKVRGIERTMEEEVGRTYKLAGVENCEILSSGDDTPVALRNRQPPYYLHKTHTRSSQSKFQCEELWPLMTTWKWRIIVFLWECGHW